MSSLKKGQESQILYWKKERRFSTEIESAKPFSSASYSTWLRQPFMVHVIKLAPYVFYTINWLCIIPQSSPLDQSIHTFVAGISATMMLKTALVLAQTASAFLL